MTRARGTKAQLTRFDEGRRGLIGARDKRRRKGREKKEKKRIPPLKGGKQFREKRATRVGPGSIHHRFTELSSSPPPWYPWWRDSNGRRGRRGACVRCVHYNWISPRGKERKTRLNSLVLLEIWSRKKKFHPLLDSSRWKILVDKIKYSLRHIKYSNI